MPGIEQRAACWAHARRKFVEASRGRKHTAAAHQIVALIAKLYQIESNIKDKPAEERMRIHLEKATPIIEKIKACLVRKSITRSDYGLS